MTFKFLCLNLWEGGKLFDEVLAFIRIEQPDVIAFQEVCDGHDPLWERNFRSMEVLRKELAYPFDDFAPCFVKHGPSGKVVVGNAIFSRFPILDRGVTFFDIPFGERPEETEAFYPITPRNLQRVALDINGESVQIFNTQGIWGTDGRDHARRLEMGRVIADEVSRYPRVVLAGDFNVNPDTQTITQIERHLSSVFKEELESTFNMQHKTNPNFATAVVDMIFVSPTLRVSAHTCPAANVSDHLPLLATIAMDA